MIQEYFCFTRNSNCSTVCNLLDYWSSLGDAIKTGRPTYYNDAEKEVDGNKLREYIKAMHNIGTIQADESEVYNGHDEK